MGIVSHRRVDLAGERFGRLVVQSYSHTHARGHRHETHWRCLCDCGVEVTVVSRNLRSGNTRSCGCFGRDARQAEADSRKRSYVNTPEWRSYHAMKTRCLNPAYDRYKDYGGRGITVCDRWLESFDNFFADMGRKPTPGHSLDRIDNDKGYSPDNCRWATHTEQTNNQRSNVRMSIGGEIVTLAEWARRVGISEASARQWRRRTLIEAAAMGSDQQAVAAFIRQLRTCRSVRCYWCNRRIGKGRRHPDHIVPLAKGGRHDVFNLCASCDSCNLRKVARLPEDFNGQYVLQFTSGPAGPGASPPIRPPASAAPET